jgi:hypothetical protein
MDFDLTETEEAEFDTAMEQGKNRLRRLRMNQLLAEIKQKEIR